MDKKKKVMNSLLLTMLLIALQSSSMFAQNLSKIQFCDRAYEYSIGKDSVTLFLNMLDKHGNRIQDVGIEQLENYLVVKENGSIISLDRSKLGLVKSGKRIPTDYTFSVLVDLSISDEGKEHIYSTIGRLVEVAPEGSVFLSFFGDEVSPSMAVNTTNYQSFHDLFLVNAENKYFYSGLYAKLLEFDGSDVAVGQSLRVVDDYSSNEEITSRALLSTDKNLLFVFTDGGKRPSDEGIGFIDVVEYQASLSHIVPRVMAFYYTESGEEPKIEDTLKGLCSPRDELGNVIAEKEGRYMPSNNMEEVLRHFEEVVNDAMYDYSFTYKVADNNSYAGSVEYVGEWKGVVLGMSTLTIGSPERPWPIREYDTEDVVEKLLWAAFITFLMIALFFSISRIFIPFIRSKTFAAKYYKRYVPEENINKRICHYCKQEIQEGQFVVTKCKHIMHVACWQQNGYKCAEYGQNCKTGIQTHIEWSELFTLRSLKECYQTFSGILAGFVSWIIYEFFARELFVGMATTMTDVFYQAQAGMPNLYEDCVNKISAFLAVGTFLGFFLSFAFRMNDEYKKKNLKVWLKILGLSLLTSLIGALSFAIGAIILCSLLSVISVSFMPWYCSLPAYVLFSIFVSLSLTIKSTIPMKSALLGGLISAIIGFVVISTAGLSSTSGSWMNMLLDFIIYGGGLGASLVTVRMLAERYFLIVQTGIKAGMKIPIHKWMNAVGGGNKVSIGMTGECEIQMNWEKSNKVAKEHAQLFIDYDKQLPMIKPLVVGVIFNTRAELPVGKPSVLSNGDTFKIGDTIFQYVETE